MRQRVNIEELEQSTKIRAKYLRALEDERFELLPSHTYVKGFLRSYAEYLGLDGQLYVDEYNSRFVVGEEDAQYLRSIQEALNAMIEAAAVPETYFTVHYNLFMRGHLAEGETLLAHGGSSGIGTTAIQLAKAAGARVIVTAGSDEKCKFCRELGADEAINYKSSDWSDEARRLTDHQGVDVVLDIVGAPYAAQNLELLRRDGRYVLIAFLKGSVAELDLRIVLSRRLTITGSTLRPQTVQEKAALAPRREPGLELACQHRGADAAA